MGLCPEMSATVAAHVLLCGSAPSGVMRHHAGYMSAGTGGAKAGHGESLFGEAGVLISLLLLSGDDG